MSTMSRNDAGRGAAPRLGRGRLRRRGLLTLACAAVVVSGCNWITAGTILLGPRRIEKAKFTLTEQRLAVFVDYAHPEQESPVFDRALYDQLAAIFREQHKHVPSKLVPYEELVDLRRASPDFPTWSVQRIGRELNADQVLFVRVEALQLRPAPDHPLLEPAVSLKVKIIGVPDPSDHARLWPEDAAGHAVHCKRMPEEATGADAADSAAAKLGREAGRQVAMPFYDVDTEERPPKEA
jgi:hypothetical protein